MRVYIVKGSDIYDVTQSAGAIQWKYELDTLAGTLSVSVASELFGVGDAVILKYEGREIYRGIIVSESGKQVKDFTCMDLGWYLNKNELIKQFNKSTVYDACVHLVNMYGIPLELPDKLKTATISKLYKDVAVGDILRDLLDHATKTTNNRYYMRMFGGVLAIRDFWRDPITVKGIGKDYDLGKTIENMSNKVVIVSNEEKNKRVYAEAKDDASIKKFGQLQTIESVEAEDLSKARNIAKNKLKELNKIEENFSFSCEGNFDIVAGRRVVIEDGELKGMYLVREVTHNYKNDRNYRCDLVVERWENFVGE